LSNQRLALATPTIDNAFEVVRSALGN